MLPLKDTEQLCEIPEYCNSIEIKIDANIQPNLFAEFMRHKLSYFFKGYAIKVHILVLRGHKNIHVAIKKDSGMTLTDDEMDFLHDLKSTKGVQISFHQ